MISILVRFGYCHINLSYLCETNVFKRTFWSFISRFACPIPISRKKEAAKQAGFNPDDEITFGTYGNEQPMALNLKYERKMKAILAKKVLSAAKMDLKVYQSKDVEKPINTEAFKKVSNKVHALIGVWMKWQTIDALKYG